MFWNRKPKCPITPEDKQWIEKTLTWIDKNVVNLSNQPLILPNTDFFDREFTHTDQDAYYLLEKIGSYLHIDTSPISLFFYSEASQELAPGLITQTEEGKGTAGWYSQNEKGYSISIEIQQLQRTESLVATIVHELCHYVLLGIKQISLEGEENEWLTDLLSIAYGFGIFMGNSKFYFNQWQSGDGWGGWQYSTQGYLPLQIIAYAMAEIQFRKNNTDLSFTKYMTKDLKKNFLKSFKFIRSDSI